MNPALPTLALFVPADRPERFAKAAAAQPDAVILDLEDAVARADKAATRAALGERVAAADVVLPLFLRVNAAGDPEHAADLTASLHLPLRGLILPKAERADDVLRVADRTGLPVIALMETALGLANIDALAGSAVQIAFGSLDFAADLAMAHTRETLLLARARIVLASRLAGNAAPIDGVTTRVHDDAALTADCIHAVEMGFGGKLLIHPAQVAPARRAFAPTQAQLDWAARVIDAVAAGGVAVMDGAMIDAPVLARAHQILRRQHSIVA